MKDVDLMPTPQQRARKAVDVRGVAAEAVGAEECGDHAEFQRLPPCDSRSGAVDCPATTTLVIGLARWLLHDRDAACDSPMWSSRSRPFADLEPQASQRGQDTQINRRACSHGGEHMQPRREYCRQSHCHRRQQRLQEMLARRGLTSSATHPPITRRHQYQPHDQHRGRRPDQPEAITADRDQRTGKHRTPSEQSQSFRLPIHRDQTRLIEECET